MTFDGRFRLSLALGLFAAALLPVVAMAQSGPGKAATPPKAAENGKAAAAAAAQKQIEELAEAAKVLPGTAGKAECVWLGRRIVILLWRDDIDTALRHLTVYDRFDCPGAHVRAAFSCLVKQGPIDPKAPETLNSRAFACWLHPDQAPQPAATAAPPASGAAPAH